MKLWCLEFKFRGYDLYEGFVIRAETSTRAREIATECASPVKWRRDSEEANFWMNEAHCEEVTVEGEEDIIQTDFHPG